MGLASKKTFVLCNELSAYFKSTIIGTSLLVQPLKNSLCIISWSFDGKTSELQPKSETVYMV